MTDDIFKIKPTKTATIEDDEKFFIHSQSEIIQKLRMLEKSRTMITVYFDEGKQFLLTGILGVLADKKMVLLDYSQDKEINDALLKADKLVLKASWNGVSVRFDAHGIIKARYQNQSVFACPLPHRLLWVQRRDTHRVRIPIKIMATCLIHHAHKAIPYRIHDISVGGIALEDTENSPLFALGATFERCEIDLPDHGTGIVNLEVRSLAPLNPTNDPAIAGRRIGCRHYDLRSDVDAMIQRFIHAIDTERRKVEDN